jgi:hypothetical protein
MDNFKKRKYYGPSKFQLMFMPYLKRSGVCVFQVMECKVTMHFVNDELLKFQKSLSNKKAIQKYF